MDQVFTLAVSLRAQDGRLHRALGRVGARNHDGRWGTIWDPVGSVAFGAQGRVSGQLQGASGGRTEFGGEVLGLVR